MANVGLVYKIVNEVCGRRQDRADLVQEGLIGLFEGVRKFDPMNGAKLSSAVYWHIKGRVLAFYQDDRRRAEVSVEKVPTTLRGKPAAQESDVISSQLGNRLSSALSSLTEDERLVIILRWLGEGDVTLQNVADAIGVSREAVHQTESKALRKMRKFIERGGQR